MLPHRNLRPERKPLHQALQLHRSEQRVLRFESTVRGSGANPDSNALFAFAHAPMATLMPFVYTQIAFALAVSFVVFRHVPDGWAWVGMAVIAACGAVSAWLNARQANAQRPASIVAADTAYD